MAAPAALPEPAARTAAEPAPPADAAAADESLLISAPMLGTFYRAEAPGAPPFVDVGARVEAHTIVCLIEVMKMMNAVPAGVTGTDRRRVRRERGARRVRGAALPGAARRMSAPRTSVLEEVGRVRAEMGEEP